MGDQVFWAILTFGLLFQAHSTSIRHPTCNQSDSRALRDFVAGFKTLINGWETNLSSNCCEWEGTACNSSSSSLGPKDPIETGRVVKLELPNKRLVGKLSESLGSLDQLRTLNLSHNFLKGSLPVSLFQLQNLQVLDLSSNAFSGPVPASIHLPSIQTFDVSQNSLNGTLPAQICANSLSLRILKLEMNYFSGNLAMKLGDCSSLEKLSIQDNKIFGTLEAGIGNLTNLVHFDISSNGFSGTIPDVFDKLEKLASFIAHSNGFTGIIPKSLSNSPTLTVLNVRNNSLEGPIKLNCTAMVSLASLDLATNRFHGPIPENLPSCKNLRNVNLARNNLSGQIPESFKNFHSLSDLSLSNSSNTNISSALRILQNCRNLTTLVMAMNFHYEALPEDPTLHLENLKILIIANCRLTGSIPQWLRRNSQLELLDLSWNQLGGKIPPCFGNFKFLFYLDLSNNSFSGEIPRSITRLRSLINTRKLSLEQDSLNFPIFLKRNVSLRGLQYNKLYSFPTTVDLSHNNLRGPIWPEFGNLQNLQVMVLKNNLLSGPIPGDLSRMSSLEVLDLSHNKLSGTIPSSLVRLSFLSKFCVAYNELHGSVPTGGQFSTFPNSSFEGNDLCWNRDMPCTTINQYNLSEPNSGSARDTQFFNAAAIGVAFGVVFGAALFQITSTKSVLVMKLLIRLNIPI